MGFKFLINLNSIRRTIVSSRAGGPAIIQALYPQLCDHPNAYSTENPNFNIQKRWHLGHSHSDHHDHHDLRSKEGEKIFRLGLAADICLAIGKALSGYICGSTAIIADAAHSVSDVVLSGVVLLSFKASMIPKDKEHPYGGSILGVRFLDPLAGLVVAGMILKAGLETGHQSVLELVDAAIPSHHLEPFKHTILQVDGVKGCNHLRGRRAGSSLYLDVNIEVDPFSSVSAAHDVGENVRREIQQSHPEIAEVFIHIGTNISRVLVFAEPSTSHIPPSVVDHAMDFELTNKKNGTYFLEPTDMEDIVSHILSSKFSEKMVVERITRHLLQGQILLQIEVSMSPDIIIRDAMEVAEEAEKQIMESVSNIIHVSIQLRLGRSMPPFQHELLDNRRDTRQEHS